MKNKLTVGYGIIAVILMIAMAFTACEKDPPESVHEHDWGDWTPDIYPNAVLGGIETRICKTDNTHTEGRKVTRPSDATVKAGDFADKDRWTKQIALPETVRVDFEFEDVEGEKDVCKITVKNAVDATTRWRANMHYYYDAEPEKSYVYKFKAKTVSGTRLLSIQCYYDFDTEEAVFAGGGDVEITSTWKEYTLRGGTLPGGGIRSLQFLCADKVGTFYVKMVSIEEYTIDDLSEEERWSKWVDPSATVALEYTLNGDVCEITATGTAMGDDNIWKAIVSYLFEAQANTPYTYVIKAWLDEDNPWVATSGDEGTWLNVQYYYDNGARIYKHTGEWITQDKDRTFTLESHEGPIIKGGIRELQFQLAHGVGKLYIKIISIAPSVQKTIAITEIPSDVVGDFSDVYGGGVGLLPADATKDDALEAVQYGLYFGRWSLIFAGGELENAEVTSGSGGTTTVSIPLYYEYLDEGYRRWTGSGEFKVGFAVMNDDGITYYFKKDAVDFSAATTTIPYDADEWETETIYWGGGGEGWGPGGDNGGGGGGPIGPGG